MRIRNLLLLPLLLVGTEAMCANDGIRKLQFIPGETTSRLEIQFAGKVNFHVADMNQNMQVVIDADNASLAPELTKIIDLSSSRTPVIQVTPYNAGGKISKAKIVVQLRNPAQISSEKIPGKFILEIKGNSKQQTASVAPSTDSKHKPILTTSDWMESDHVTGKASANDKSNEIAKQLMETLDSTAAQKVYHGTNISFEASGADVHDVFRLVGEASGLNILTTSDVKATLSLALKDVPWDQLLDIVLLENGLKASIVGNVVRISTLAQFNKDAEIKKDTIRLDEELDPVIMAILPLSYAKASDMKKMIATLLVHSQGVGGGPGAAAPAATGQLEQAFVRGQIELDDRSNSLVITNTKDTIERIRKLVKELDVPLPQVLIDSKIVIASESFSKTLGISYSGLSLGSAGGRAGAGFSFNNGSVNFATPASGPIFNVTSSQGTSSTPTTGAFAFQTAAGQGLNLAAALQIGELNGVSKTVGSPRVVVNNKQQASVSDGVQVPTVTPGTVSSPATTTYVSFTMSLNVTPQITSAGSVLLDVDIHKDAPASGTANIDSKQLKTQVLVDSGATLVLGGVYQFSGSKTSSGIPLLMDLPFIGPLFRTDTNSSNKEELMVFITPQILDTGSAGITDKM